jgi:ATP-dependent DNA ligase
VTLSPPIAEAARALRVRSCQIDGEAVACGHDGMPVFDRLRYRRQDGAVVLFAFDLIELSGQDLRREPGDAIQTLRQEIAAHNTRQSSGTVFTASDNPSD